MKDKLTYGSLLNVYAQTMLKQKTEETFEQWIVMILVVTSPKNHLREGKNRNYM
jgi:hypothetical protein